MKILALSAVLLLVSLSAAEIVYRSETSAGAVTLLESSGSSRVLEFNLPALEVIEASASEFGEGVTFRIPMNGGIMGQVGSPDLPVIRRMVLVPPAGDIEVEVLQQETQPLGLYSIVPFQQPPTYSGGPQPYRINSDLYSASAPFPSTPVEVESVEILRDIRIAWVSFCPVSYDPATGQVDIVTSAMVSVTDTEEPGENELPRAFSGYTRSFERIYEEVIGVGDIQDTDLIDGSYVFIGSDESIDLAEELISWKKQKGYDVEIGLLSEIGSTSGEIDTWLENAYSDWPNPPEYVMLVGDDEVIPSPQYSGDYTHAADNEFAAIGSSVLPSMHIGRVSGNDTDDLAYVTWKIREHEMSPYQPGPDWFMYGFSMACTDFEAPEEALRLHQLFMANAIDSDFYCAALGGTTPSKSQVVADINEGRGVISYIGHGDINSWITTGFSISDISSLTNGRKMPWVFTIGCQNGEFDGSYCFCEGFLSEGTEADPKGAITVMGSSTYTPVGPGDTLQVHTFRGYFTEEIHHLGAAHTWGKTKCNEHFGGSGEDMIMMAHVFGCPETDIYNDTAPLSMLSNSHSSTISTGDFDVLVTDDSKAPVEGALVGVYYADTDQLLDSDYTDASGYANLYIESIPGASLVTITSTCHNREPDISYADPTVAIGEASAGTVTSLYLENPSPNPVISTTSIEFGLPSAEGGDLEVYDLSGRIVRSLTPGDMQAGANTVSWNGTGENGEALPNGVYCVKLSSSQGTVTRMVLLAR